jgi:hypothetical protein
MMIVSALFSSGNGLILPPNGLPISRATLVNRDVAWAETTFQNRPELEAV